MHRTAKSLDVAPLSKSDRAGLSSFVFGLGLLIPSVLGSVGLFLLGMRLRLWWRVAAATLFALLAACGGVLAIDTILGALLGLMQGVLAVIVFVLVTIAFFPGSQWLTDAKLPPMLFQACHISMDMGPKDLSDQVENSMKKLKRESPSWMHPSHPTQ